MTDPIRLGTRASVLARTQSATVGDALAALAGRPWTEVLVTTPGDDTSKPLDQPGSPGLFVSTLRKALLAGDVDVIVHSFKDLPSAPEPGLVLAAVPSREDPRDALVSQNDVALADLPAGSVVGTSSPRRSAALLRLRPDLAVVPIRGNVDTRIRKARDGEVDATVLAVAGLTRIGRADEITEVLPLLPAPAQGALAVECRATDREMLDLLTQLDDPHSRLTTMAEREVLVGINAECTTAIAALATWADDTLSLTAELTDDRGNQRVELQADARLDDLAAARELGQRAAAALVAPDGRPVLLVRGERNAVDARALAEAGVASISDPYVRTTPSSDPAGGRALVDALRRAVADPDEAAQTWVVATSPMAAPGWQSAAVADLGSAVREAVAAGVRAAATGDRTAQTLRDLGFLDVLTPEEPSAAGLAAALADVPAGRAIFPRGNQALRVLPDALVSAGWRLAEAEVYETTAVPYRPGSAALVESSDVAAVVVRSPSAVRALVGYARVPMDLPVVCAGRTTASAAEEAGLMVAGVAVDPSPSGLARAVVEALGR
ncbi:MAG: hydroxymethylbilane synthase [Actinomycetales bacterium]|nr:hydroxymethylbilane synthase [Actinomycetales bacterium]